MWFWIGVALGVLFFFACKRWMRKARKEKPPTFNCAACNGALTGAAYTRAWLNRECGQRIYATVCLACEQIQIERERAEDRLWRAYHACDKAWELTGERR
jgi:hypothetical protein